ncbi:ATP-binding protein [Clostridium tyrobutyricum]|uniref:ATP-binding protein n=1 Tax=Clostridium tyrobutyricum TaxID=1519 RepID=UPI002011C544|nr:ATP-binding protein [Clostridium tyrobutyricum]MBR9648469.1 ATP-binding protein [Clostridium tyrobutyricum]
MKLKTLILKNFRSYHNEVKIEFEDITTLIGKNDVGKSTILEALEIFFNNETVKIDSNDFCVICGEDEKVDIGCVFTDLPNKVVIDSTQTTTLESEYLLNEKGELEIHKIFNCNKKSPTFNTVAFAMHPDNENVGDLLKYKISKLKTKLKELKISEESLDLRSSSSIRKSIWENTEDLQLKPKNVDLDKEEGKNIWNSLKKELPIYALFQSDRPSRDEDSEVQDPMKLAVKDALKSVQDDLNGIQKIVQDKAKEVAKLTIEKLKEMDKELADELIPKFKEEPKWSNIFKLTLEDGKHIPINKRGSGVRRLILLNFFRAQVQKKKDQNNSSNIIYAIEEPETSQHPDNQRLLVQALLELSEIDGCQIILTTHVPELAGLIPVESLRLIEDDETGEKIIGNSNEDIYLKIADELGVLPDRRVKVIICVEGPNDVEFLQNISSIIHNEDSAIVDISKDPRVIILPLGGGSLKQWVHRHYLRNLRLPEVHIYDRDTNSPPKYKKECDEVNLREDGSWAVLTKKREIENYLDPKLVSEFFDEDIDYEDNDDVPNLVKDIVNKNEDNKFYKISEGKVKRLLNSKVSARMTSEILDEIDTEGEIKEWLNKISKMLS